jgi:hypothetical protein
VLHLFNTHIQSRRAVIGLHADAKIEGEHGGVFYTTVRRLATTVVSLQSVVATLEAAGLAALVDRIDLQAFSSMFVEHWFSLVRSHRDAHPDVMSYCSKVGSFIKEFLKHTCRDVGFNYVLGRRQQYQYEARSCLFYHSVAAQLQLRRAKPASVAQLSDQQQEVLAYVAELIKPTPTQAPRAKTKKRTGVAPSFPGDTDPAKGQAPLLLQRVALAAPRSQAKRAAQSASDEKEETDADGDHGCPIKKSKRARAPSGRLVRSLEDEEDEEEERL